MSTRSLALGLCALLWLGPGVVRAEEPAAAQAGPAPLNPFDDLGLHWYEEAYQARSEGDLEAARYALEQALEHGADPQLIALELGYLGKEAHDLATAQGWLERAQQGQVPSLSRTAGSSLVQLTLIEQARGLDATGRVFWLEEAWRAQQGGLWDLARQALERAQQDGADPQLVTLELGYLEARAGDLPLARAHFAVAARGPDAQWARVAQRELDASDPSAISPTASWQVLVQQGWLAKQRGDHALARGAFENAAERGADPQLMSLELAYLAIEMRERHVARGHFEDASRGPDAALAAQARRELAAMNPRRGAQVQADPRSQPWYWLEQAWNEREDGAYDRARQAFMTAADLGASPQRVALELGYLELLCEKPDAARARFEEAAEGEDAELAEAARAQLLAMAPAPDATLNPAMPEHWLQQGWDARDAGDLDKAREAFFYARELGASSQRVALELAYVSMAGDDRDMAMVYFEEARLGVDPGLAAVAAKEIEAARVPEPGESVFGEDRFEYWLEQGWALRDAHDWEGSRMAFLTARELGADPAMVALELGFTSLGRGDRHEARLHFIDAAESDDPAIREPALAQLEYLDGPFWSDLYGDTYGWWRLTPERSLDLVPLVRLRGYWTPWGTLDLHGYLFLQISRDMASRASGPSGYPVIYADNTLMFGPGVLARFWQRQAGIYAQLGPSLNLVDDGEKRWWFDARIAAYAGLERGPARPGALARGERARGPSGIWTEVYAEAVYASRFDHNVIAMARGRAGLSPLITGRVAWQPLAQARAFADLHGDYWNNRADLGLAHRWRWQTEVPVDLLLGFNLGSYYGRENLDDAPDPLLFTELWLQVVTLYQF